MKSKLELHVLKYLNGCGSEHCAGAKHRVFVRGDVPCDVLLIGEAPGESEDVCGVPFIGPAGRVVDQIIARALQGTTLTHAFGNVVNCIPRDEGKKLRKPDWEQIEQCGERLVEFINLCEPRLLVAVGEVAEEALDPRYKHGVRLPNPVPRVTIVHPAWILRQPTVSQSLHVRRCVITIRDAVEEYILNPKPQPDPLLEEFMRGIGDGQGDYELPPDDPIPF